MPRGRPRLEPKVPPTALEDRVAQYLHEYVCMMPGCIVTLHLVDARNIIALIKEVQK